MNILAFDTGTDIMYVTLERDNLILDSRTIRSTEQSYNSAFLISTIADIIKKNNLKMADLDALGVNIGPGSFTGLRASVTVARVIAQQLDIPAVGVSSFQIYSMLNDSEGNSFCIMDARRGKAYVGIYNKDSSEPILQPCAMEYEQALELAKSERFFIISDDRMMKKLEENSMGFINFMKTDTDFGGFLVKLISKQLYRHDIKEFKWHNLKPLYIQPPPISTPKNKVL